MHTAVDTPMGRVFKQSALKKKKLLNNKPPLVLPLNKTKNPASQNILYFRNLTIEAEPCYLRANTQHKPLRGSENTKLYSNIQTLNTREKKSATSQERTADHDT